MTQIVIIDYGSQYTHLIANRIRRLGVYTEIIHDDDPLPKDAAGFILSGGPNSVYEEGAPRVPRAVFERGVPVLGLCYGHQLIGQFFGGEVKPGTTKEYGVAELSVGDSPIFTGLSSSEQVWMSHGDAVQKLPEGFRVIGSTDDCPVAAMEHTAKRVFGLQFHPEVTHSTHGMTMLSNFVFDICGCAKSWNVDAYLDEMIRDIKETVGSRNVFMLVSGGVDSSVAYTLLNKALGAERVYGLFINNGLLRKGEFEAVQKTMTDLGLSNFNSVDATEDFLAALRGVYEPEKKRTIIGDMFLDVQRRELVRMHVDGGEWLLGQGTIYPDTIESKGTKHADLIKTHHNRVPQIQAMIEEGRVIEPLHHLYKDEVRELGMKLGLPAEMIERHPFPGPGLGVRCLCNKDSGEIENERQINEKISEVIKSIDPSLSGYVIPLRSVGVQGDVRTYRHPAVVEGEASWETLSRLATALTNKVFDINRVIVRVSPKGKGTEVLHGADISLERLDILREADDIAMREISLHGLDTTIWQMPVVLVPWGADEKESIVLRPVSSTEAMTAEFSKVDMEVLTVMSSKIMGTGHFSGVFFDVTNKPPGTIEWE